ncbi:MAG: hypothetical protein Q9191_007310 [Dirinaria sp. TL-2023a]
MYPPKPAFTEQDVPDLTGKVYIVTGSNTGVGKEVAQILYSKNASVYMAARSQDKAKHAIADIQQAWPQSKGSLTFLYLDLADLTTIKPAVERFTARESKLHVLFNNAAVQALQNDGSTKTAQGYEWHFGVNVMGPFLFTQLLTPILVATAKAGSEPANTVRVVWRYGVTKAGNWLHGVEFAKRYEADGVISVPCNPGHLRSDLYRDGGWIFKAALSALALFPPVFGAYTELYTGLSPTITIKDTGKWVVPWGRPHPIREGLLDAIKPETEGGNGHARKFWEWSEEQVRPYS